MATPSFASLSHRNFTLQLPVHDYEAFTYVAGGAANDDNIATISGKLGGASGTSVGTLTFTYVGATNNVASVTLTLP